MTHAGEKFFFHMHNFDDDVIDEADLEDIEDDLPPPPPVFTESELEAEKKKAFQEGHAQGVQETESSRAQALANAMQTLSRDIKTLFDAEHTREKRFEQEVVTLCKAMFEQAFPAFHQQHGFDELSAQLHDILKTQHAHRAIELRTSSDLAKGVEAFMEKLKSQNPDCDFVVLGDDTLQDGQFLLKWEDGGASYDAHAIAQQIIAHLDDTLAIKPVTSHDDRSEESNTSFEEADIEEPSAIEDSSDNNPNPTAEDQQ